LATTTVGQRGTCGNRIGRQHRSLPHPRIVRGVGIHGRATTIDRLEAQFVVPGLVAIDLAQSVPGAVFGQPRPGIDGPDVDSVAGHVSRRVRGGDPSGSFLCRPVFSRRPRRSDSGTPGKRQPLLTENSMPLSGGRRRFGVGPAADRGRGWLRRDTRHQHSHASGRAPSASVTAPSAVRDLVRAAAV